MPLWQIYHPDGTFEDDASKASFAKDITKMYTDLGLPAFYVVVQFLKMDDSNVFVSGKTRDPTDKPFIRVVINHVAIHAPNNDTAYFHTTSLLDGVMKPHLLDQGYDFEYHVGETERRLWKINLLIPPPFKSPEEQLWVKENRTVPYDGAYPPAGI